MITFLQGGSLYPWFIVALNALGLRDSWAKIVLFATKNLSTFLGDKFSWVWHSVNHPSAENRQRERTEHQISLASTRNALHTAFSPFHFQLFPHSFLCFFCHCLFWSFLFSVTASAWAAIICRIRWKFSLDLTLCRKYWGSSSVELFAVSCGLQLNWQLKIKNQC